LGAIAGLLGVVVLAAKPDLLERPTVKRMLSASEGTEADTFQWRLQERWPHFWRIVQQNPWFGVGTDVDLSLGPDANTPHNGYLAIALIYGLPALGVILTFAVLGIRSGVRVYRRGAYRRQSVFGITIAAALIGVLIHNIDDATLQQAFIGKVFWLLIGLALAVARRPALVLTPAETSVMATARPKETVRPFSPATARI
jgi:O-antigen ligase